MSRAYSLRGIDTFVEFVIPLLLVLGMSFLLVRIHGVVRWGGAGLAIGALAHLAFAVWLVVQISEAIQ